MSGQDKWRQNPYITPGVIPPIHLKRRSESSSAHKPLLPSGSSKRPSTSGSSSVGNASLSPRSTAHTAATAAAKVKYPYTVLTSGKKHHAYPWKIAPYPLNYESRILDYDALDTTTSPPTSPSLVHQIVLSDRTTHPRRVLDVGCGNGSWCINTAALWPDTSFVGLDLVAIQPDPYALERIASLKTSKSRVKPPQPQPPVPVSSGPSKLSLPPTSIYNRIKWVHHNFLIGRLPFKDAEFDLIRVRCIAQGIPEDEWTKLFRDLTRVLSPGGWLEIIEEDIVFPVVIAPTVTFGRTSKSARQNALKSYTAQQALNKQSLIYSEETRPSAYLASPTQDSNWSGAGERRSPLSPVDSASRRGPLLSPNTAGTYSIPSSYVQYTQTAPALARSLPPLALINPSVNQMHFIDHEETRPFAQDHAVLEQLFNAVFTKRWINLEPTSILGGVLGMEVGLCGVVASECLEIARPCGSRGAAGTEQNGSPTTDGRRRGSGGTTLLGEAPLEVDEAMRQKDSEHEEPVVIDVDSNVLPSPSLPAALSPSSDSPVSPVRPSGAGSLRVDTSTGGIRKYPSLALTASLHSMFPNLDSDIVRAVHLQRAWENVVACKEAMWDEFLSDSVNRDKEARAAMQTSMSQNISPSSVSATSKMPSATPGTQLGMGSGWRNRRAPTLLDELEWADSDQRRSERERFDILLDRYEMRIRRYCARIFQTSTISRFVPRDRQGWGDADPDSPSDDDVSFEEPEEAPTAGNASTVGSPSMVETPFLPRSAPEPIPNTSGDEVRADESEGHSSADEVTLVEPQSPHGHHSISSVAAIHSRDPSSLLGFPSGSPPTAPLTPMLTKLKLNAEALRSTMSPEAVNATPTERGKGKRKRRSSTGKQPKDDSAAMPCRIVRAFIATKTMTMPEVSTPV